MSGNQTETPTNNPSGKRWATRDFPPRNFYQELGLPPFHSHLLYNRGIRGAPDADLFLNPDARLLHSPDLLPDIAPAVARLRRALDANERIAVFGDFDADGITGTALLTTALTYLDADVVPYIPHRVDEGHGLNSGAVQALRREGVSLLITVDCGATNIAEVDEAAALGIDTIITDHHSLLPALPASIALINPKHPQSQYPFGELTGVGMSFKLIEALHAALGLEWPEHLLEFVALGTVSDVGPLVGENRFLVKKGLERINRAQNPGLRALAADARLTMGAIDTEALSFGIIPRLNVAGRFGVSEASLELLTTRCDATAQRLAHRLAELNAERQTKTRAAVEEAEQQLAAQTYSQGVPPHNHRQKPRLAARTARLNRRPPCRRLLPPRDSHIPGRNLRRRQRPQHPRIRHHRRPAPKRPPIRALRRPPPSRRLYNPQPIPPRPGTQPTRDSVRAPSPRRPHPHHRHRLRSPIRGL